MAAQKKFVTDFLSFTRSLPVCYVHSAMRTVALALEHLAPAKDRRRPVHLLELIGNTPLLDLSELTGKAGVRLFAKAEWANPGGSVKDRPALSMVMDALRRGLFTCGRRLLDATSGNTGIAYAMIGAALGIPVTLALPGERQPRAQAHPQGLWRRAADHRSAGRQRRRHPGGAAAGGGGAAALGLPRSVLESVRIGALTTAPRGRRSGSRPRGRSPTSSPALAPAAPSWASAAS